MKPLVLHFRACNFFGGPERQIIGHIAQSRNFRHVVLTFFEHGAPNELFEQCKKRGIPVKTMTTGNPFAPSYLFSLRSVFRSVKPDIICTHGYKPSIMTLLACIGQKIPLIMFSRGHTSENMKVRLFENLERHSLRFADFVISVSEGYTGYVRSAGVPVAKIHIVQNAIDIDRMHAHINHAQEKRKELGFGIEDVLIATAGRLSPEKAQADLIIAFSHIYEKFPKARLLIIGDGAQREHLELLVREQSIRNVSFLGFRHDVDAIMNGVDLFVLPSLTEGLPNVILEAFACSKPVVATSVGGVPEIVDDGISGFLVPPSRPDLLADAVEKLLSDPELRQTMGQAGYLKVKAKFTFEAQTRKLESIYHEILGRR